MILEFGIDYSLNSTAMCINEKDDYRFVSFFNYGGRDLEKKILKAFQLHFQLSKEGIIEREIYARIASTKDEYVKNQQDKLYDATNIANAIMTRIIKTMATPMIYLEGFSFGSKGNSFIDMILHNTVLRKSIYDKWGKKSLAVYSPTHVKKLAGKGNAGKPYMFQKFQENYLKDPKLKNNKFWKWCSQQDFGDSIPKPIDDLVDSYWVLQAGSHEKCLDDLKTLVSS